MNLDDLTLDIEQHITIKAAPDKLFPALLHRLGEGSVRPDGESLHMLLEPHPGGRWYRDRGNGIGHLWGFVQTIKPPTLLELSGPMFMSYPAVNHLEVRIEEVSGGSKVVLRHRALGMIDPEHRKGVGSGWDHILQGLKQDCE